jgi:hypothetical protein
VHTLPIPWCIPRVHSAALDASQPRVSDILRAPLLRWLHQHPISVALCSCGGPEIDRVHLGRRTPGGHPKGGVVLARAWEVRAGEEAH